MRNIIKKISGVIQVILLAPIKLPGKFINVIKYIGLGLGILESVIVEKEDEEQHEEESADGSENTKLFSESRVLKSSSKGLSETNKVTDSIIKYDLETGKEVLNENE